MMRKVAWMVAALTLLATGAYTFVYLYRWEWHRALLVGLLFVAAEIAVVAAVIMRKLTSLAAQRRDEQGEPPAHVIEHLREAAPRPDHFGWLDARSSHLGVFIPILLGGGVLVSAVAWIIERAAGRTADPVLGRSLAARLARLQPPERLVPGDGELLANGDGVGDEEQISLMLGVTERRS